MKLIQRYQKHKELLQNFFWRGLQVFGKEGITFLIFILCAKLLNPYDFGIYNYILAIVFLLIIFGDFGISTATSKYVAEYNATNKEKLKPLLFNSLIIIIALGSSITLIAIFLGKHFFSNNYLYVLYVLPMLFLAPISSLYDGIFRGLKRFKSLAIISVAIGVVFTVLIYFAVKKYGLIGAFISQDAFYLSLVIVLSIIYRNLYFNFNKQLIKKISKYSLMIGLANLSFFLISRINVIFLEKFNYILEIGTYSLVNKYLGLLILPFGILCQTISPHVTEVFYTKQNKKVVLNKMLHFGILSFVASLFLSIIAYFVFLFFIRIFLPSYANTDVFFILKVFLAVYPLNIVSYLFANGFSISTGHAHINLYILLFSSLINIFAIPFILHFYSFEIFIYFIAVLQLVTNIFFIFKYFNTIKKLSLNDLAQEPILPIQDL